MPGVWPGGGCLIFDLTGTLDYVNEHSNIILLLLFSLLQKLKYIFIRLFLCFLFS